MKRRLLSIMSLVFCAALAFAAVSCNKNPNTSSTTSSDDTSNSSTSSAPSSSSSSSNSSSSSSSSSSVLTKADISTVITQNNNTNAIIEGTVFGTITGGYYVSDTTGSMYITDSSTAVALGDKVNVSGKYVIANGMPTMTFVSTEKISTGNTALSAIESSVDAIADMITTSKANYAKYVTISGVVAKDGAGRYSLSNTLETKKVYLLSESNDEAFASWVGKNVVANVIVHNHITEGWTVSYVGDASDITLVPIDVDSIKAAAYTEIDDKIPATIYGILDLPTSYSAEPNLNIAWSVKEGTAITVTNNVAIVSDVSADATVKLELKLSSGTNHAEKEYTITVKAIRTVAIADLASTTFATGESAYVNGTVVMKTENYSTINKYYTAVLADSSSNFIRVDMPKSDLDTLKLGDSVKVLGNYTKDAFEIAIVKSTRTPAVVTAAAANYSIDYSAFTSTTLDADADYTALLSTTVSNTVKLFKIVDPYLILSGTNSSNYVRFGSNAAAAKAGYDVSDSKMIFCTPLISLDANNLSTFANDYGVPTNSANAKEYAGYSFYAFAVYRGDTTWQFAFNNQGIVENYEQIAKAELSSAIPATKDASAAGVMVLPTTCSYGALTWTANPANVINATTGVFSAQAADVDVTLTATFLVNNVEHHVDFNVKFTAAEIDYLSVTEALALEDGDVSAIEGTVVGFGSNASIGAFTGNSQVGIYLSDGSKIMYINNDNLGRIKDETVTDRDEKSYAIGDHVLEPGDVLEIVGASKTGIFLNVSTAAVNCVAKADVANEDKINWTAAATVLDSHEDLSAYFTGASTEPFKLVKFVATPENPLYLGKGSNTTSATTLRLFLADTTSTAALANIKYSDRLIVVKAQTSSYAAGDEWWSTINPVFGSSPYNFSSTSFKFAYTGSFYALCSTVASDAYYMDIISEDFSLKAMTEADWIAYELAKKVPSSVNASVAGTISLPNPVLHDGVAGGNNLSASQEIVWTIDAAHASYINMETKAFAAVSEDVTVTLTASYSNGGKDYSKNFQLTLVASAKTFKTVTEAKAIADDSEVFNLTGYVGGIGSIHAQADTDCVALYIVDNNNMVAVTTFAGTIVATNGNYTCSFDGTNLAIGDLVKIENVTINEKGAVSCTSSSSGTIVSSGTDLSGTWFNPDSSSYTAITDYTSLTDFSKTIGGSSWTPASSSIGYKILKVTGSEANSLYLTSPRAYLISINFDPKLEGENFEEYTTRTQISYELGYAGSNMSGSKLGSVGFSPACGAYVFGSDWMIANTPMNSATITSSASQYVTTTSSSQPAGTYEFTGDIYLVFEYTNTYNIVLCGILSAGFSLTAVPSE